MHTNTGNAAQLGSTGVLDEAYERLHRTGPEFSGWLSNHGPMAADALARLGAGDQVHCWVNGYARHLEDPPEARWPIDEADWREPLGDASRLGDWVALFARLVHAEPWQHVLIRWWPRLLPGAVAAATHGLIRTGHAVRALRDEVTEPRIVELAHALGYWAARWEPLPGSGVPDGHLPVGPALDGVPALGASGGIRTRLAAVQASQQWPPALNALAPVEAADAVPRALDALTDAAVSRYRRWAHGNPVMLVHAATAPRAAALVVPVLPRDLWLPTYSTAWTVSAAITAAYRPANDHQADATPYPDDPEPVTAAAVANHDEHVIKFTEVAVESHRRGNHDALPAAARAAALVTPNW